METYFICTIISLFIFMFIYFMQKINDSFEKDNHAEDNSQQDNFHLIVFKKFSSNNEELNKLINENNQWSWKFRFGVIHFKQTNLTKEEILNQIYKELPFLEINDELIDEHFLIFSEKFLMNIFKTTQPKKYIKKEIENHLNNKKVFFNIEHLLNLNQQEKQKRMDICQTVLKQRNTKNSNIENNNIECNNKQDNLMNKIKKIKSF